MKTLVPALLCLMLLNAGCATSSPPLGTMAQGICTRDLNPWGHASQCSCEPGWQYDQRAGLCLDSGEALPIMVQGKLMAGVMAIGGETTGFVITTSQGEPYDLFLKMADQEKLLKLDGLTLEVEGDELVIQSLERNERKAIIVEKISVLE